MQALVLWQLFYVSSSTFIKSSICTTLMRIADVRQGFVHTLQALIVVTVLSTIVAISAVFARCKPIQASWNPTQGTCIDQTPIIILTYIVSGVNIITDFTVAGLPIILLWNMHMQRRLKIGAGMILGVGVLFVFYCFRHLSPRRISAYSDHTFQCFCRYHCSYAIHVCV